jgi:hypothetical protein
MDGSAPSKGDGVHDGWSSDAAKSTIATAIVAATSGRSHTYPNVFVVVTFDNVKYIARYHQRAR